MSHEGPEIFIFRLYIAGGTPNSIQAQANLAAMCKAHLPGRHRIEVVDVFAQPGRALADGIFMTPTLVRLEPGPVTRCIGTLSDTAAVLDAMGMMQPQP